MNEILTELARLSVNDLRRISRMVDLIVSAERCPKDTARAMLDAGPPPETYDDARQRLESVIGYLEANRLAAPERFGF